MIVTAHGCMMLYVRVSTSRSGFKVLNYSRTCLQQPPLGVTKVALVGRWPLYRGQLKWKYPGGEEIVWPLHAFGSSGEVANGAGLTVHFILLWPSRPFQTVQA